MKTFQGIAELAGATPRLVVDGRSSEFLTAWHPAGELAERTVLLKVTRSDDPSRGAGSHHAKATRGLVVRQIITDAIDARRPEELAEALSSHFVVDLWQPDRRGQKQSEHGSLHCTCFQVVLTLALRAVRRRR